MAFLYIAGQRPGSGATAVAASLATLWKRAGHRVAAVKPATLGEGNGDAVLLDRLSVGDTSETPIPVEADEPGDALLDRMVERATALEASADVVIVEGLPFTDATGQRIAASPALAERLGARVLGIVPCGRTLDGAQAALWRDAYASSLAAVVLNRRTHYGGHDTESRVAPAFEDAGVSVAGIIPEQRLLLAPTVRQVVDLLDGTFYAGLSGEEHLIEHFLIGGLITEWGGNYFSRLPNQAVMVRGGRTDIQMAALNFPLTCLLLTGCDTPPQYVYQRARDLDVPLIVVGRDTHEAAAALEQLDARVSVDHPDKLAHLAAVLETELDLGAVRAAAGL